MGLWNCQSAVNKADLISAFSLLSTHSILGLTETWICPEDSATPAALSNNFSFSHTPHQVGPGWGHWSAHFKQLEILNPLSPMQLQLIWISCDYCNSSYKTLDFGNLPSHWPNSSPLPRGAGRADVLFHGGWHSTLSFWRFQHSSWQALCYRLSFTPSFIWSQSPYHNWHAIVLRITFWYNHYIPLTISSLHLHNFLPPGCHQPPYRLLLDEIYTPFHPHICLL